VRIVPIFIALVGLGCGGAVASEVRSAADEGRVPDNFSVTYDDQHPRWGGERLTLRADGHLTLVRYRPGSGEGGELSGEVPAETVEQTIRLLASIEAWEQRVEHEEARIDDAKARLIIEVGGARSTIWEWANDLETNGRIIRVKQQLEALAAELRHPMIDEAGGPPTDDPGP
jgi:hypothetical protein